MRLLFGVSHPKHVYIFKNVINNLYNNGHEIKIIAVDKEITLFLLKKFNMPCTVIGKNQSNLYKKVMTLPKWEYLTYKISKEYNPDIFIGRALPHFAHISGILHKPFIIFEDTEIARSLHRITLPFANAVVTPECYYYDLGKKHIRFNGFFELEYLHPDYFKPDPSVLTEYGLEKNEKIIIVRFVAWKASHDIGDCGFSNKVELIRCLEKKGKVIISSELKLPDELKKFEIFISPEKLHHLMYYADLFIGESATMAAECAILGTPGILVSTSRRGYTDELEKRFDMVYTYSGQESAQKNALIKAIELLDDENTKRNWAMKRDKLLNKTVDVTGFMTDLIENYHEKYQ